MKPEDVDLVALIVQRYVVSGPEPWSCGAPAIFKSQGLFDLSVAQ